MKYEKLKINGLNLHLLKTKKFKTNLVSIKFRNKMCKETSTKRSLLPFILKAKTDKYDSKTDINNELDNLYGATLSTSVTKMGKSNIISFNLRVANELFIPNETNLLKNSISFLTDILFNHEEIDKKVVEEEKRLLKLEFESEFDNKRQYTYNKLMEIMLKDEEYKYRSIGVYEDIDKIDEKQIQDTYKSMLLDDEISIFVSGDFNNDKIISIFDGLKFNNNTINADTIDKQEKEIKEVINYNEVMDVSQSLLNIGYRTNTRFGDNDHYALALMNSILGGSGTSKLFMNVREKHSLAYSCSSNLDSRKGLLFIFAGITHENFDKAKKIIFKQVSDIKEGNFTNEDLEISKINAINELNASVDYQYSTIARTYNNTMINKEFSIKEIIAKINQVTHDDIVKVSNKIVLDCVYFLTNKEISDERN